MEIVAAADVIRDLEVTTIAKCRFDAEYRGGIYVDQPVTVSRNLVCARGKKDISLWMRMFVEMLQ